MGIRRGKGGDVESFRRFSEVKKCKLLRHSPLPNLPLFYPSDSYLTNPDPLVLGPPFSSAASWPGTDAGGWDRWRRSSPGNPERRSCKGCTRALTGKSGRRARLSPGRGRCLLDTIRFEPLRRNALGAFHDKLQLRSLHATRVTRPLNGAPASGHSRLIRYRVQIQSPQQLHCDWAFGVLKHQRFQQCAASL